jgi:Na+/proline symporter
MTLVWGVVLIFLALLHWGAVLEAGLTVSSLTMGCLVGLFLLGTFDPRAHATGALTGMFAGLAAVLFVFRFTPIAFTWYVMIGTCVTFAVGALASRIFRNKFPPVPSAPTSISANTSDAD